MIRRDEAEKREIIHIVEHSALAMKKTLEGRPVPRRTLYRGSKQYQEDGTEGLIDHRPNPGQIGNRLPPEVKQQVVDLALQHPDRSPRQIAWLFTDEKGYFISESSAYRILKGFDLVESPAFTGMSAAEKFQHPTTHIHELWQTDCTYFKIQGWGWYYLSTVLDDFSRYILAWKLTPTMNAKDVQDTLLLALQKTGLAHVLVELRPRLLSDNGACYISKDLQSFLERRHIEHTHRAPYHPMTQGKIERYQRSMKNIVNLQPYFLPGGLESEIANVVDFYNHQRDHESLDNLTPADVYSGRVQEVLNRRAEIKNKTLQQRRLQNLQVAAVSLFHVGISHLSKLPLVSQMF
jgi:putative transposase